MKTIKQLAEEIGVSKTAVRKKFTPEMKTRFAETTPGIIYISSEDEEYIKQSFSRNESETEFSNISANQFSEVSKKISDQFAITETLIDMLKLELEFKNRQISDLTAIITIKDNQILELTASLNTAQALHAGTIQKQLTDSKPIDENLPAEDGSHMRRWWQFWK